MRGREGGGRPVPRQVVRQRGGQGDGKRNGDRNGGEGSRPGPRPGGGRPAAAPIGTQLAGRAAVNLIRIWEIGPAPGRGWKGGGRGARMRPDMARGRRGAKAAGGRQEEGRQGVRARPQRHTRRTAQGPPAEFNA